MRNNLPVTKNEVMLSDTETIVSVTDLQGKITYANPYFIEVSGFLPDELIGAPQNILRHPDMPVEAFADLWHTIKQGQTWTGMVKNRCKNGDFYWVVANVTPVIENGQATGYISVRTKPDRAQVAAAQALYQSIKAGNSDHIRIEQGAAIKATLFSTLARKTSMNLPARIACNLGGLLFILLTLIIVEFFPGVVHNNAVNNFLQIILPAAGCLSILWFWYSLHSTVVQPLQQASKVCQIMAGGDLMVEIRTERQDEVGQLLRSLRQLRVNLHSIVRDVRHNLESVNIATQQIAVGNSDLSARTEAQASALEETASSMEELAATVQQNSEHSDDAKQMSIEAAKVAALGGGIVGEVVHTMNDIGNSSKRIVDIIDMIESIAFQTNILALNAAVEAARAGDQGRGFAVVANEVRSLAQRSSSAAKEIGQLIADSVQKIDVGVKQVEKAGATMNDIIHSVQNVSEKMVEIASATLQQSAGIAQVNQAILQMDQVTQQNAALVEQAASSSHNLHVQAKNVMQTLMLFKLEKRASSAKQAYATEHVPPQAKPQAQSTHDRFNYGPVQPSSAARAASKRIS